MSTSNRTVLCVTYGGGHATMVAPVAKILRRDGYDVQTLALTMARSVFLREELPFMTFSDFLLDSDEEALLQGRRIADSMHSDHTDIPRDESVAYLGLSYQDLVRRLGESEARRAFEEKGRMAFLPLSILKRVFDRIRPGVVVTTNSPRAEQAARLVAAERKIPTVALSDLLGTYIHPMSVDHLCLACRPALEPYRQSPLVQARHFHVVGNPAMDAALGFRGPVDRDWRAKTFPSPIPDARYVLSAEQYSYIRKEDSVFVPWTPEQIRENLDRLYRGCAELRAVLLVRPHPSLPPDLYRDWIRGKPAGTAHMADREELYPLLRSSDLVISNNSTIMLDALYLRRPVLLVHYPGDKTLLPFDEMGFAFSAPIADPILLRETLRRALEAPAELQAKALRFQEEFPELPCAPRIAEIVKSCL